MVIPENGCKESRYAKLLVEVDLTKSLIWGTKLRCNGKEIWIEFKYENIPLVCFYCGKVGHGDRLCGRKQEDIKHADLYEWQFGEWFRMGNRRGLFKSKSWRKPERGRMMPEKHENVDGGNSFSKEGFWQGKSGTEMANKGRKSSNTDNARQREGEETIRERKSSVVEGNREKESEDLNMHVGMVTENAQKDQIEESDGLVKREKKEAGKFGGVLCEFDQNSEGQDKMNLKNRKGDS